MTAGLEQVNQMKARVPNQPALSVFAPVLEFGAARQAGIVFDYATAQPDLRPKVLLDAVGQLDAAGKLDQPVAVEGGLTTGRLAAMADDVGVTDISRSVLTVLGDIKAGRFANADSFIAAKRAGSPRSRRGSGWTPSPACTSPCRATSTSSASSPRASSSADHSRVVARPGPPPESSRRFVRRRWSWSLTCAPVCGSVQDDRRRTERRPCSPGPPRLTRRLPSSN
ncbi:hypothetical protein AB0A95_21530 [Micromonospora sp. NPDC049230]|uniref:hypothetical protein n=1 Tax=Micromonospora sp. NPDC049230 TaxID=3155502 RepID=UPI00340D2A6E